MKFIKPIFLGVIAAGGALVFELLLLSFFPKNNFPGAALSLNLIFLLLAAAIVEEFFKLLIIYKSFYLQKNGAREFLYFSLLLGFGFAMAEIYISGYFGISGSSALYSGILGIIFIHTLSAGLMGWLLLKIKIVTFPVLIIVLFIATLLHFAYNAAVIAGLPR